MRPRVGRWLSWESAGGIQEASVIRSGPTPQCRLLLRRVPARKPGAAGSNPRPPRTGRHAPAEMFDGSSPERSEARTFDPFSSTTPSRSLARGPAPLRAPGRSSGDRSRRGPGPLARSGSVPRERLSRRERGERGGPQRKSLVERNARAAGCVGHPGGFTLRSRLTVTTKPGLVFSTDGGQDHGTSEESHSFPW